MPALQRAVLEDLVLGSANNRLFDVVERRSCHPAQYHPLSYVMNGKDEIKTVLTRLKGNGIVIGDEAYVFSQD